MSSAIQLIGSEQLAPAPYAYAATAPAGSRLIFLAGACPLDSAGAVVSAGDPVRQAAACLDNLEVALEAASAARTDVISTRVLVASTDRADLVAAWDIVAARFGDHDVPSTLVGVTVLGYPGQLVEIEAVAAVVD